MWIQDNWYDEKVIFLNAYIDTHQKSSCRGKEMRTKDTASKYFLEVLRTNSTAEFIFWAGHYLPMKVLKQKNNLEKFISNAETYLEPPQMSKMELLGLTIFDKKLHHRFSIGFQTRLCNGRRHLKVK